MADRVSNHALLDAGLSMLASSGKTAERQKTGSRAMIYELATGETLRVRTCNDHVLVVLADSAEENAGLNIEGTDHLLIVMPAIPRRDGPVISYLVPTAVAAKAVRAAHAKWLASTPATKGNNRTWNVWFDDFSTEWSGFADKWSQFRLHAKASTLIEAPDEAPARTRNERSLGLVIAQAREEIARAAGVSPDAVKISVELS